MLTFQHLTLQCYHHSLIQFHSLLPHQFIQNHAQIHRLSHLLHSCSLSSSMKSVHPMLHKTNISLTTIIFKPIWMAKQRNRKWQSSLPSSEGSSFWKRFQFGCVFEENKSRVCRMRASFHGMECVNEIGHGSSWGQRGGRIVDWPLQQITRPKLKAVFFRSWPWLLINHSFFLSPSEGNLWKGTSSFSVLCLEFKKHFADLNTDLQPNLTFDLGYIGDLTT